MNNRAQITIMPQQKTAERVEQSLFHVGRDEKFPLLLGLLRREGGDRILIFLEHARGGAAARGPADAQRLGDARAHRDVDQKRRLKILNDFKEGRLPILVATDVASRGLHIEAVTHVVNWDLPQRMPRTTCTASAAPRAPARAARRSASSTSRAPWLSSDREVHRPENRGRVADDDVFLQEIKPTAEERRRYNEERRARLAARDRLRRP